jgi:ArsR family transcriptional regulator
MYFCRYSFFEDRNHLLSIAIEINDLSCCKQFAMELKKVEKISKALADPNRLQILKSLHKKQSCMYCSDINEIIDLAQPSVSHHLKQLTDAELIIAEKEGRNVKYTMNNKMIDLYVHFLVALKV